MLLWHIPVDLCRMSKCGGICTCRAHGSSAPPEACIIILLFTICQLYKCSPAGIRAGAEGADRELPDAAGERAGPRHRRHHHLHRPPVQHGPRLQPAARRDGHGRDAAGRAGRHCRQRVPQVSPCPKTLWLRTLTALDLGCSIWAPAHWQFVQYLRAEILHELT